MTDIKDLTSNKKNQLSKEVIDEDLLILADIVIDIFLAQKRAKNQSLQPDKTISYTNHNK